MNKNQLQPTLLLYVPSGKTRSPDDKGDWVPVVLGPWLSQSNPILLPQPGSQLESPSLGSTVLNQSSTMTCCLGWRPARKKGKAKKSQSDIILGVSNGASGERSACQCRRHKRSGFNPWAGKIPWRRKWQPTPVFLPGKFHGQRSLVGYRLWGREE